MAQIGVGHQQISTSPTNRVTCRLHRWRFEEKTYGQECAGSETHAQLVKKKFGEGL